MKRWRFTALSMPILAALLFWSYGGGVDQETQREVHTLVLSSLTGDFAPDWGVIDDRSSLEVFMRRFFQGEKIPDVDFGRNRVLFLLAGPQGGRFAGFEIQAYRKDSDGGITVFCEKKTSSASGHLITVPRFQGEAVFFFQ